MEREQRRLVAILAADVAGYSRLMSADELGTLAQFKLLRQDHVEPALSRHGGRLVGEAGDSLLVEFASTFGAVTCAAEIQEKLAELNAALPERRRMQFRVGVNLGEVILDGTTIHGDGVKSRRGSSAWLSRVRSSFRAQCMSRSRARFPTSSRTWVSNTCTTLPSR